MKKAILLLIIPIIGFSQHSNDVYNININGLNFIGDEYFLTYEHQSEAEHITVPEGEYWYLFLREAEVDAKLVGLEQFGYGFEFYSEVIGDYNIFNPEMNLLSGGTKFYFYDNSDPSDVPTTFENCDDCIVRVFKYETTKSQNSLSFNETEAIQNNSNNPVLFPNPTSSLLALNSDKQYDIEVYDMLGNKLMALTGNTVNMEHLSTATYIVKATDKSNNEELTYKVVKN